VYWPLLRSEDIRREARSVSHDTSFGIVVLSVFSAQKSRRDINREVSRENTDIVGTSCQTLGDLYIPVHLLIFHTDSRLVSGRVMRLVHTMIQWYVPLLHLSSAIPFSPYLFFS
jgi:hypothetical protein